MTELQAQALLESAHGSGVKDITVQQIGNGEHVLIAKNRGRVFLWNAQDVEKWCSGKLKKVVERYEAESEVMV